MKINKILCFVLCLYLLVLPSCTTTYETQDIEIVEDESFFNDVKAENGYVYYYCTLTIKNNSNEKKSFKLKGDFSAEQRKNIIETAELFATCVDDESETIIIGENDTIEDLSIVFIAKMVEGYDGDNLKEDRLLPHIEIIQQ